MSPSKLTKPAIRINVDVTNPGQFFACCGLLELADRLWPGAQSWFEDQSYCVATAGDLTALIQAVAKAELSQLDAENNTSSPIAIRSPFREMHLDWWHDDRSGGKELKVWAGSMKSVRIARAMQQVLRDKRFHSADLLNVGLIVYDPADLKKKVEPFYFDARRGPNAHSRDVGFSLDELKLTTTAFPAVEFLCLVGLQRCLPAKTNVPRVYNYSLWEQPVAPELLPPIVSGHMPLIGANRFRFENWFRTGKKMHKAFRSAISVPLGV